MGRLQSEEESGRLATKTCGTPNFPAMPGEMVNHKYQRRPAVSRAERLHSNRQRKLVFHYLPRRENHEEIPKSETLFIQARNWPRFRHYFECLTNNCHLFVCRVQWVHYQRGGTCFYRAFSIATAQLYGNQRLTEKPSQNPQLQP